MKYKLNREQIVRDSFGDLEYDGWFEGKPFYFASSVSKILHSDLLAKEDKKECKHNYNLERDEDNDKSYIICAKCYHVPTEEEYLKYLESKVTPTPSPLEIEEIEEYFFETSYDRKILNKLIRNQKKLYQLIKEKL